MISYIPISLILFNNKTKINNQFTLSKARDISKVAMNNGNNFLFANVIII